MEVVERIDEVDVVDQINNILIVPRFIRNRTDYFNYYDDLNFVQRFRLAKQTTLFVLELIEEDIEYLQYT